MKCKIPKSKNQIEQKYKNYKPTKVYKKRCSKKFIMLKFQTFFLSLKTITDYFFLNNTNIIT